MKQEAPDADEKHVEKGHLPGNMMIIPPAILNPPDGKVDEEQVRQSVDNLSDVNGRVVILRCTQLPTHCT